MTTARFVPGKGASEPEGTLYIDGVPHPAQYLDKCQRGNGAGVFCAVCGAKILPNDPYIMALQKWDNPPAPDVHRRCLDLEKEKQASFNVLLLIYETEQRRILT